MLLLILVPASAHADIESLLGKYATTDDGCRDEATQDFEVRRGILEGPNLLCILGAPKEGAGQEVYEAKCTQGDQVHLGTLIFDLSAKDPIKITLPESKAWIALYACK